MIIEMSYTEVIYSYSGSELVQSDVPHEWAPRVRHARLACHAGHVTARHLRRDAPGCSLASYYILSPNVTPVRDVHSVFLRTIVMRHDANG